MKNPSFNIVVIILIVFCSSCASIKPTQTEKTISLEVNNLEKISGFYSNEAKTQTEIQNASLWKQIKFLKKDTIANWKNHKIELEVINEKRIKAKLWLENNLISEKILKGKIKDNYFSVRRQVKIVGVPFIYFFTSDNKFEIGLVDDNKLIVNRATGGMGMIFIMSAGGSQQFTGIYPKK